MIFERKRACIWIKVCRSPFTYNSKKSLLPLWWEYYKLPCGRNFYSHQNFNKILGRPFKLLGGHWVEPVVIDAFSRSSTSFKYLDSSQSNCLKFWRYFKGGSPTRIKQLMFEWVRVLSLCKLLFTNRKQKE